MDVGSKQQNKKSEWFNSLLKSFSTDYRPPLTPSPKAEDRNSSGTYNNLFYVSYNGEKNLGEAGPVRNYMVDYDTLRLRSWQLQLESELAQTIIGRFSIWVVGSGLKLQSEPVKLILESEGKNFDRQEFTRNVEARFNLFKKSTQSDYSGMSNLDMLADAAHRNAIIGGDCLVVLRLIDGQVKVQLIDGAHVQSPAYGSEWFPQKLANGNEIKNGIEIDPTGQHVRYFVRNKDLSFTIIDAKGKESGLTMAFLVYGLEYRLNNVRGLPLIAACIETLKKMERYKEATLGSAEEVAKIAFSIEHDLNAQGDNPFEKNLAKAISTNANGVGSDLPEDINGKQLADTVIATTNKQVVNLPTGAKLAMHEGKSEIHFRDFYEVNTDILCATVGIPPNVAMSKYDTSFSSARAAIKDWEHTLNVKRERFSFNFYQKVYEFWLEVQILKNKIQAPGYLIARLNNNYDVVDSYRKSRFIGASVPHIDPVKEAEAERVKLGTAGAALPLTTQEAATEALGCGESESNTEQFAVELAESLKLKIVAPFKEVPAIGAKKPKKTD